MLSLVTYLVGVLVLSSAAYDAPSVPKAVPIYKNSIANHNSSHHISGRDDIDQTISWECDQIEWDPAFRKPIQEGIEYLRGLSGIAQNDARKCGRVSCSYSSGITWCNDNDHHLEVSWGRIADGVQSLLDMCPVGDSQVNGRAIFSQNWNVFVKGEFETGC